MKIENTIWALAAAVVCAAILITPNRLTAQDAPPATPAQTDQSAPVAPAQTQQPAPASTTGPAQSAPSSTAPAPLPTSTDPVVGTSSQAPPAAPKPAAPAAAKQTKPAAPVTPPAAPKPAAQIPAAPKPITTPTTPMQGKGAVVDDIVAHVNNEIISLSDYQKAQDQTRKETQQECNCTGPALQAAVDAAEKNVLRGMIDQQLLIERAKDMNIDVTADVVSRLNDIRKQNNLGTLDDLQKAVEQSGESWDDFKQSITNNALTQEVIRQEVGQRVDMGPDEVKAYYDAHKAEFDRPEEVILSEIELSTEGKSADEVEAVKKRADDLRDRVTAGESFPELAKRYSEDPATAASGGELGAYQRGQLAPQIEDAVFKLNKGAMTDVIQTKEGFMIIHVDQHYQAGEQPLDAVQQEIESKLYEQKMDPQLRKYLGELREQSYVVVKAGYTDSAAVTNGTAIQEVAPTPDAPDKKAKKKMSLPKVST
jgi:peptidyl-prolyl cis-trans isomerase SurA